jgi:hypothetical protein
MLLPRTYSMYFGSLYFFFGVKILYSVNIRLPKWQTIWSTPAVIENISKA